MQIYREVPVGKGETCKGECLGIGRNLAPYVFFFQIVLLFPLYAVETTVLGTSVDIGEDRPGI